MKSFTINVVPLAFSVIMAGQLLGQENNNANGDVNKEPKTVSVTGCLGQSDAPGTAKQYIIKSADMTYELERVGVSDQSFSKLNSPAHQCPCLCFDGNLTISPARLRVRMESLSPFL